MNRPYTLPEPIARPQAYDLTRRSDHRTDAHRQTLHGPIEPLLPAPRVWWWPW